MDALPIQVNGWWLSEAQAWWLALIAAIVGAVALLATVTHLKRRLAFEQRRAETQRQRLTELAVELAEERQRHSSVLAETMSRRNAELAHELGNPLTAIQGYAGLLLARSNVAGRDRRELEIIARETERLARIVRRLANGSRTTSAPASQASEPASATRSSAAQLGAASVNILVLDDEAVLARLLGDAIELMGFHSTVCTSPTEALRCVEQHPVTLVFSDFRMPGLNGEQFYWELVARHPELARRVVFLTSDADSPDTRRFFASSGVPHLDKPCSMEQLQRTIRQQLAAA